MDKYKNRYRIKSHRKPHWDYSAEGLYFLTINTQNRVCNLGKIVHTDGCAKMQLSDFGKIVQTEWYKSFEIRNELVLHEFVIMPNHLHAIVEIKNDKQVYEFTNGVHAAPLPATTNVPLASDLSTIKRNAPIRLPKSISSFIAGFKSAVNTKIDDYIDRQQLPIPKYNRKNHFFQPNYYDHIIRNDFEYKNISNYIINNPANWNNDTLHA